MKKAYTADRHYLGQFLTLRKNTRAIFFPMTSATNARFAAIALLALGVPRAR
jgi:hypothetical protein